MMERSVYLDMLIKLQVLSKPLDASTLAQTNANQVRVSRCDYYGGGHANSHCVQARYVVETYFARNYQKPYPYFNNNNPCQGDHSNLDQSNTQFQIFNQASPNNPPPKMPSPLEETLNKFTKSIKNNFEAMKKILKHSRRTLKLS